MSMVTGHGPLSSAPAGWFSPPLPAGARYVEPHARRVQAFRNGDTVIDTEHALLVHRPDRPLSYAFRAEDAPGLPSEPVAEAPGFVYVPWDAVDTWIEEGRTLVHYPPNPYHRVDCRPTTRRLRVEVGGKTLVDTDNTTILFETSLEPRLYVDPAHVRTELLLQSNTSTYCNYKGWATYWSSADVEDVAWSYLDPPPESQPIKGFISFDAARATVFAELPGQDRGGA
ncbi:hypothetical protein A5658_11195 [Mycobacterium sp. 1245111.1]|uniref:DUF427 domain-containing protein n=1 Tax=Mycobacterium sp. 1245111.1 TaxID=1834073 RepID=UPI0008006BD2|nr:DUF427 domain-containing protein [Mycobacterium sp. 1245111.1]OBK34425.1 hypothetical protein A5658_11195 [Mycobacterium sp. 1245111.1]